MYVCTGRGHPGPLPIMTSSKPVETDEKGIPLKGTVYPEKPSVPVFYGIMNVIFTTVGYLIANYGVYRGETIDTGDAKMILVKTHDMGWLFLGMFLLKLLQLPISTILGMARKECKVNAPDQHVYKVCGAAGSKLGYVLMENEGHLGKFNRAQRALMIYHEKFPSFALQYIVASFVFPKEAFICIMLFAIGALLSALGYVKGAESRLNGYLLEILSVSTIQGMLLIVAKRTLM